MKHLFSKTIGLILIALVFSMASMPAYGGQSVAPDEGVFSATLQQPGDEAPVPAFVSVAPASEHLFIAEVDPTEYRTLSTYLTKATYQTPFIAQKGSYIASLRFGKTVFTGKVKALDNYKSCHLKLKKIQLRQV